MIDNIIASIVIIFGVYFIITSIAAALYIFGIFDHIQEKLHDKRKKTR